MLILVEGINHKYLVVSLSVVRAPVLQISYQNMRSQHNDKPSVDSSISTTISSSSPFLPLALFGGTVAGILAVTAPFVWTQIRSPLPYMATPGRKVAAAMKYLSKQNYKNDDKKQWIFVDWGSGDGEAVLQAAKYCDRAVGIELNATLYWISQLRRTLLLTSSSSRNYFPKTWFLYGDIFSTEIKELLHLLPSETSESTTIRTDVTIMMFGVQPLMESLSEKVVKDIQACGTRVGTVHVLSYRFLLPVEADSLRDLSALKGRMVYDQEEMRIYECFIKDQEEAAQ